MKQTDPLTGILTRAQNLCAAQGYSVDICRQVAKAADTNDLTLFETELDTYIERVEMAESELDKARQGGDAQAVETARHAYLNALNRLSRQIHSLKTGVAGIRMPNLAELISWSANTAVSEQAAYNTGRQQAGRRIDRHLTDPQQQNIGWKPVRNKPTTIAAHTVPTNKLPTMHISASKPASPTVSVSVRF